jgi:prefoldin subunit 5
MARHTAAMAKATQSLPTVEKEMAEVAAATDVLPQMEKRMAAIEAAMPVLVEVQQHLAQVPDTLASLDGRMVELSATLDRLLIELDQLGHNIESLQTSVGPLGRLADRFPGRNRE